MLQQQFAARRVRYPDVSIISANYKQMEGLVVDEMKPISSLSCSLAQTSHALCISLGVLRSSLKFSQNRRAFFYLYPSLIYFSCFCFCPKYRCKVFSDNRNMFCEHCKLYSKSIKYAKHIYLISRTIDSFFWSKSSRTMK